MDANLNIKEKTFPQKIRNTTTTLTTGKKDSNFGIYLESFNPYEGYKSLGIDLSYFDALCLRDQLTEFLKIKKIN